MIKIHSDNPLNLQPARDIIEMEDVRQSGAEYIAGRNTY